jgi:hypothetical protein
MGTSDKASTTEIPEDPAVKGCGSAARTLIDLCESWEWSAKEERRDLVRMMIQEVSCDVGTKCIGWDKVNPDYEILFRLMDRLRRDAGRGYWIREQGAEGNTVDIEEEMEDAVTEVKIAFSVSHITLNNRRGVRSMKGMHFKSWRSPSCH